MIMSIKELKEFDKIRIEDFSTYEDEKSWNGGCYSYTETLVDNKDGTWESIYTSSSEMFEPRHEMLTDDLVFDSVNQQIKYVEKGYPYADHIKVTMSKMDNILIFTIDRKDR